MSWYEIFHWFCLFAFCSNEIVSIILMAVDEKKYKETVRFNSIRGLIWLVLFVQTQ